jgi:hypothetical protein
MRHGLKSLLDRKMCLVSLSLRLSATISVKHRATQN